MKQLIELIELELKSSNFERASQIVNNAIISFPDEPQFKFLFAKLKIKELCSIPIKFQNSYTGILESALECFSIGMELTEAKNKYSYKIEVNKLLDSELGELGSNFLKSKENEKRLLNTARIHGVAGMINMANTNNDNNLAQAIIGQNNINNSQYFSQEYQKQVQINKLLESIFNGVENIQEVFRNQYSNIDSKYNLQFYTGIEKQRLLEVHNLLFAKDDEFKEDAKELKQALNNNQDYINLKSSIKLSIKQKDLKMAQSNLVKATLIFNMATKVYENKEYFPKDDSYSRYRHYDEELNDLKSEIEDMNEKEKSNSKLYIILFCALITALILYFIFK